MIISLKSNFKKINNSEKKVLLKNGFLIPGEKHNSRRGNWVKLSWV
jgi:hypothetical protein